MYTVIFSVFKKKFFLKCDLLKSLFIIMIIIIILCLNWCVLYIFPLFILVLYHFDEFCK